MSHQHSNYYSYDTDLNMFQEWNFSDLIEIQANSLISLKVLKLFYIISVVLQISCSMEMWILLPLQSEEVVFFMPHLLRSKTLGLWKHRKMFVNFQWIIIQV